MGAIAQQALTNPRVVQATIHDVDSTLLVQAGKSQVDGVNFSAPITLHDSIAGYVNIKLTPANWASSSLNHIVQATLIACALISAFFIYQNKNIYWQPRPQASKSNDADTVISTPKTKPIFDNPSNLEANEHLDASLYVDDTSEEGDGCSAKNSAYAALCVKNVGTLQQQLNGATFRNTFSALENFIEAIGHLYSAKEWHWQNDRYIIEFSAGGDEHEALFNAACASRLMLDLCGIIHRVPLDLAAQISLKQDDINTVSMPFVGLAIDPESAECKDLSPKVAYLELGEDAPSRMLIKHFCPPYAELLQKQTNQFRSA